MNRLFTRVFRPVSLPTKKSFPAYRFVSQGISIRYFSDEKSVKKGEEGAVSTNDHKAEDSEASKGNNSVVKIDFDEYDDYQEPQTPKEKVRCMDTNYLFFFSLR